MSAKTNDPAALPALLDALTARFGERLLESHLEKGELSVRVTRESLLPLLAFLRDAAGFNALNDMIGLDNVNAPVAGRPRFAVLYQLYKFPDARRIRIVVDTAENEPLPSITGLYQSADWAEREIFDMFGLRFAGHPGLTRIYLDDEFKGHPLRKDFPLAGA
ncbi:MAG: NADH-quinone oxidoreductase subunit C [Kiritimatiellaeota bacterium]|nr:NADH-quinone oxidoreductase subunit C [Kiritimatiellota bacterium]